MAEKTGTVYHIEKIDKVEQFEKAVMAIKGVTLAKVDTEQMTFEYAIDEWASDYDVFTKIMDLIDDYGVVFDFSYAEKKHDSIKQFKITGNEEMQNEFIAHGLETESVSEVELEEESPKQKKKSSEIVERCIEIGASLVFFAISFLLKDLLNFACLALSFSLAGYEVLYRAFKNVIKKRFISEELIISVALIVAVVLGYSTYAVGACLLWTLGDFAVQMINERAKKGKVAYFAPEKLTLVNSDDQQTEIEVAKVTTGDKVLYQAGDVCVIDGTLIEQTQVERMNGKKVTLEKDDIVYAGDKLLEETTVTALYGEEQNKNYAYNQVAKQAIEQKSALELKFESKKTIYLLILLGASLLITFILPIFESSYKVGLTKWAYRAVSILILCSFSNLMGSLSLSIYRALSLGKKQNAFTGGYNLVEKLNDVTECAIDSEYAMYQNGEVKANARGAIRELKDCNVKKISLLTSMDEKVAEEVCKQYKVHEYYANRNQAQKDEIFNQLVKNGVLCVCGVNAEKTPENTGVVIGMNANENGFVGDATIFDGEIKNVPFIIKLAKRTQKIKKTNLVLSVIAKLAIVGLALSGVLSLIWLAVIDFAVSGIIYLNALRNGGEVI